MSKHPRRAWGVTMPWEFVEIGGVDKIYLTGLLGLTILLTEVV